MVEGWRESRAGFGSGKSLGEKKRVQSIVSRAEFPLAAAPSFSLGPKSNS